MPVGIVQGEALPLFVIGPEGDGQLVCGNVPWQPTRLCASASRGSSSIKRRRGTFPQQSQETCQARVAVVCSTLRRKADAARSGPIAEFAIGQARRLCAD